MELDENLELVGVLCGGLTEPLMCMCVGKI